MRLVSLFLALLCGFGAHAADTVTIALTGDILLANSFGKVAYPAKGGADLFLHAKPWLSRVDLAVGNLEGPICDTTCNSTHKSRQNPYIFRCPPEYAGLLKDAGYDFLSLANNHIRDFGREGIDHTARVLDSLGIAHAGDCFHRSFCVVVRGGVRFGCCAFGHNALTYKHTDSATVKKVLAKVRPLCDVLVVSFHGGAEGKQAKRLPYGKEVYFRENRGDLRNFAHLCIRNGADVVFGHGPHIPRCVEIYQNRFIAYSLGNFCTPFGVNVLGECGAAPLILVRVTKGGVFVSGQIYSYRQTHGVGPRYDGKRGCTRLIQALTREDQPLSPVQVLDYGQIRYK